MMGGAAGPGGRVMGMRFVDRVPISSITGHPSQPQSSPVTITYQSVIRTTRPSTRGSSYKGIIFGLTEIAGILDGGEGEEKIDVVIKGGSLLVTRKVNGMWKIENKGLKSLYDTARSMLERILNIVKVNRGAVEVSHVLRNSNKEADRLANIAMDTCSR